MQILHDLLAQYQMVRKVNKGVRLAGKMAKQAHVHEMLGVVIIVAHASEIIRVVSEIRIWNLLIAILLFALWLIPEKNHSEEIA